MAIDLFVNGEAQSIPPGLTVAGLLERLELPRERVAVERNREIVPRARFGETRLEPGDRLEIVQFVGGG
jgi:thiamine biosynthesis protein ThiS